ncbi:MAG: hypothetical protein ACOX85_04505 [Candidatus Pararuminococcus gallinarum]|jgi:hypothetical protein
MLYLVCVSLRGEEPMDFFSQLDRLGEVLQSFPGCFLLCSRYTALGIRERLCGYLPPGESLVVTRLRRDECAGRLPPSSKKFMGLYIDGLAAPD